MGMNLKKHLEESRDEARDFTVEHPESSEVGFNEGYLFALNWVLMLVEENEAEGLDFYGEPLRGGAEDGKAVPFQGKVRR